MRARVLVKPKAGILDPQGQAVERALPALGFAGVRNVHVGRLIELDIEDPAHLPEMCERLLCNPLIEDYVVESVESPGGDSIGGPIPPASFAESHAPEESDARPSETR
jgi:phosphoribosylformylglycinamidine synthase PurS subunit